MDQQLLSFMQTVAAAAAQFMAPKLPAPQSLARAPPEPEPSAGPLGIAFGWVPGAAESV